MFEVIGFREGVLEFPNGRKVPYKIDSYEMTPHGTRLHISEIPGSRGISMLREYERRSRQWGIFCNHFGLNAVKTSPVKIERVIFNDPATVVIWSDNTKTVVKCQPGDVYSKELGLAMCISKKYLGNKGNFNEEFKKWIPEDFNEGLSIEEMKSLIRKHCRCHTCACCLLMNKERCYYKASDEEIITNYNTIKHLI